MPKRKVAQNKRIYPLVAITYLSACRNYLALTLLHVRTGSHRVPEESADITVMSVELNIDHTSLCAKNMAVAVIYLLSLLLFWLPESAVSAIYTCVTNDGTSIFQDRPCPQKKPVKRAAKTPTHLPLGIHESWFELPGHTEGRAFCDRRGCECGSIERRHEGALAQAVADALFIDAGWHHYDTSYSDWLNTPSGSAKAYALREEMIEASCSVMISQQLLRDFAEDVAVQLKSKVLAAEERGFDVPEPCDQGVEQACDYYQSVELHRRLMSDAIALRISRATLSGATE